MFAPRFLCHKYLLASRRIAEGSNVRTVVSSLGIIDNSRPFKILGVQQVAIGSAEKEPLDKLWKTIFGLEPSATKKIDSENVQEDILKLGRRPYDVEIDLMTPIDPAKSPKVHIPPLNHIGLWVDNLEMAVNWMKECGVRFTSGGIRKGAAGHNVAFIHPKGNKDAPIGGVGVLIELVQAPEDLVKKLSF
mmetsp:Transcript_16367/g.37891  ORF Transcript_16367/g.37891 Transcript_16367/m.37891 type:complete len:190 (-) Transcript_16367:1295-1864(-)